MIKTRASWSRATTTMSPGIAQVVNKKFSLERAGVHVTWYEWFYIHYNYLGPGAPYHKVLATTFQLTVIFLM